MANKFTRLYFASTVASGNGKLWTELSTTSQLIMPTLSLNGDTLTIADSSGLATSFDILVDGAVIGNTTSDTFDLSTLRLDAFCVISAISKKDKWVDSVESLPVIYSIGIENAIVFSSPSSFTLALAKQKRGWNGVINYSTDASNWKNWDGLTTITADNGSLYLAGVGNTVITGKDTIVDHSWILAGSNISCSGNIENLLDCGMVANGEHPTMASYCYAEMFYDCASLITAPELSAITLTMWCYESMFRGCTSLTAVPELPATTLAYYCYQDMFRDCTGLITASELPATTLADSCYWGMFQDCTALTTAPNLPATTLASHCYYCMFSGCISLTTAPELPATTLAEGCYQFMFSDCTSLKLSTEQTDEYTTAYRIPTSGNGTIPEDISTPLSNMFRDTGGTFTGTPTINTTYYLYKSSSSDLPPVGTSLEDCTWEQISAISAAGKGEEYFNVGDTKSVHLQGTVGTLDLDTTLYVYIIGFNHNGSEGITFGTFKTASGTDICLVDSNYGSSDTSGTKYFNMNHWGNYNYGGWAASDIRYDILGSTDVAPSGYGSAKTTSSVGYDASSTCATNPVAGTLMAALPEELRAVMKPMTIYTDNTGNKSNSELNVTATVDYLPLLAEFEVQSARTGANIYEQNNQAQFSYFANGASKIKYKHADTMSAASWWVRSPRYVYSSSFCIVSADSSAGYIGAYGSRGLAPAFKV